MKFFRFHLTLAALALFVLTATSGFAQITLSSLSADTSDGDVAELSPGYPFGQSFTTDSFSSSYQLSSVTISMQEVWGHPAGFSLSLYSDSVGQPGTLLETLSGTDNPHDGIEYTYTSTGTTLNPNSTYWIVASANTGSASDFYIWSLSEDVTSFSNTGGANWTVDNSFAMRDSDDPSSWYIGSGDIAVFSVSANPSAVPEPASYAALVGLGVLGVIVLHRHRAKTAA